MNTENPTSDFSDKEREFLKELKEFLKDWDPSEIDHARTQRGRMRQAVRSAEARIRALAKTAHGRIEKYSRSQERLLRREVLQQMNSLPLEERITLLVTIGDKLFPLEFFEPAMFDGSDPDIKRADAEARECLHKKASKRKKGPWKKYAERLKKCCS